MSDPHATATTTSGTTHATHPSVLHDVDSPPTLLLVWAAVIGLFLFNVWISYTGMLGKYALFGQLAIGSVQAGLVAYHFMHLRHGDRVVILTALASIFWMGILFVLFMSDYMTRHRVVG